MDKYGFCKRHVQKRRTGRTSRIRDKNQYILVQVSKSKILQEYVQKYKYKYLEVLDTNTSIYNYNTSKKVYVQQYNSTTVQPYNSTSSEQYVEPQDYSKQD